MNIYSNNYSYQLSTTNKYTDQKVNLLIYDIEKVQDQANIGITSTIYN